VIELKPMSAIGTKRTCASGTAHVRKADMTFCAKIGCASGTFGVRYHETLNFFRIKGPLRCKANNFFGYDFN